MKISRTSISRVVLACLEVGAKQATVYLSPGLVVKATFRSCAKTHKEIVVSFGKPNHSELQFIKKCKLAKEPFPVKKMQLKWYKPEEK